MPALIGDAERRRGQALVEFSLLSLLLAVLLAAVIDFGQVFAQKQVALNAARAGGRWAASHATAWTSAASAPSNSIEGQVQSAGGADTLPNDDSHMRIEYLDASPSAPALCGTYSQASAAFVAAAGYSQASCVKAGNLVRVTVISSYSPFTVLFGSLVGSVSVHGVATMPILS